MKLSTFRRHMIGIAPVAISAIFVGLVLIVLGMGGTFLIAGIETSGIFLLGIITLYYLVWFLLGRWDRKNKNLQTHKTD